LRKRVANRPLAPGGQVLVDLEIQLFGDFDKRILVGRMQPAATDVEGDVRRHLDGMRPPADAVARLQQDHRETGIFQRPGRAEACGARADDGDIDF